MKHLSETIMGWPHPKGGDAWNNNLVVLLYNYNINLTRRFIIMSKKQQQSPLSKIVNNPVDDNSNKEVSMSNEDLIRKVAELEATVEQMKKVKHSPTRDDGVVYTILPELSEAQVIAQFKLKKNGIETQPRRIMRALVQLRDEKIEQGIATSATFTFNRMEWADAAVRLGKLETVQGADRVCKWYLNANPGFQLLEDEKIEGSLGWIQRATR